MSGFLSTWVGLFSGEKFLEITSTPLIEQPLKFIAHGRIFESPLLLHSKPIKTLCNNDFTPFFQPRSHRRTIAERKQNVNFLLTSTVSTKRPWFGDIRMKQKRGGDRYNLRPLRISPIIKQLHKVDAEHCKVSMSELHTV